MKIFTKDVVLAENASWIFRFTPYIVFGATVLAGALIPLPAWTQAQPLGAWGPAGR